MRFAKLFSVLALGFVLALSACKKKAGEEGTELTPADTAMTTPPPETTPMDTGMMGGDTMMGHDSMMMGDSSSM